MDFGAAVEKIRAELAARPPFLLKVFERWLTIIERQPLRLLELHGIQLLATYRERRRVEPRLTPRRQAIALVVGVLLIDLDLCSLRSGYLRGDGIFSGRGQKRIAELSGLGLPRIRRAIEDLDLAGYLTSTQPIEPYMPEGATSRDDLRYCAHNSLYRFTLKWFERIAYDRRLVRERETATRRRKERGRLYAASLVRARRSLRNLRRKTAPRPPAARTGASPPAGQRPPPTSR